MKGNGKETKLSSATRSKFGKSLFDFTMPSAAVAGPSGQGRRLQAPAAASGSGPPSLSATLFCRRDGAPMNFAMSFGPSRKRVRNMVRSRGTYTWMLVTLSYSHNSPSKFVSLSQVSPLLKFNLMN